MRISRIQNQIINSNLVRKAKKIIKPAAVAATLTLGGLAAGGCSSNNKGPEAFYCKGCDYVVYAGTDLNVAHETLYKQFDLAKYENHKEDIMESAALLEMADENCDEIISSQELRNLDGWDLWPVLAKEYVVHNKRGKDPAMFLNYHEPGDYSRYSAGPRIFISPNDLEKCKIDRDNFMFGNMFRMTKHGNADITIKGSKSDYEVEISELDRVRPSENNHIIINGDDIKYMKISDSKITSISISNRTKDLNIDLIDVKGGMFSPVSIHKNNTKSNIIINAVDSKYEFSSID